MSELKKKLPSQMERFTRKISNFVNYDKISEKGNNPEDKVFYEQSVLNALEYLFKGMDEEDIRETLRDLVKDAPRLFHSKGEIVMAVNAEVGFDLISKRDIEKAKVLNLNGGSPLLPRDYVFRNGGDFYIVHDYGKDSPIEIEVEKKI